MKYKFTALANQDVADYQFLPYQISRVRKSYKTMLWLFLIWLIQYNVFRRVIVVWPEEKALAHAFCKSPMNLASLRTDKHFHTKFVRRDRKRLGKFK